MPPVRLRPLRVPTGWLIGLNSLYEDDPADEGVAPGPMIFHAVNEGRRFLIDVEWLPELDPNGEYRLRVEYAPWERDARGRRRKHVTPSFADAEVVHEFSTRSTERLVDELDEWLTRCARWAKEGN
jgi:hypothetical protein